MSTETADTTKNVHRTALNHIAAAIDLSPESEDAAVLAAVLAAPTDADLMLLAVEPELPLMIPGSDWRRMRGETETLLSRVRASCAPGARFAIDTDLSAPRGLQRLARREHRQLLAIGSSPDGRAGEVSIGHKTRQLLDELECVLAIAPRGLRARGPLALRRVAVGFDGGPEAVAALATAATLAAGAGAELIVRGVLDDRIPVLGWPHLWLGGILDAWREVMDDEAESLRAHIQRAVSTLGVEVSVQVTRGRAADTLRELSGDVDLLVIGSRRWGPMARLLLGGTGEALVHGATCPLVIVPRPEATTR
jgi:nucleotide-binding universal stress UspA family protein